MLNGRTFFSEDWDVEVCDDMGRELCPNLSCS